MYQDSKNISFLESVKDVDPKTRTITGYFAHFNSWDSDNDMILPGAFSKTIAERGPDSRQPRIKYLRNHRVAEPIGTLKVLKEDAIGLYYEAEAGSHDIGQDTLKMIESGLITEHSFGFDTVRKEIINPEAEWYNQQRKLIELKMWEGSALTAWGANERTGAARLKSMGASGYFSYLSNHVENLKAFCKNSTASDNMLKILEDEFSYLSQELKKLSSLKYDNTTTPSDPASVTLPDYVNAIKQFTETLQKTA